MMACNFWLLYDSSPEMGRMKLDQKYHIVLLIFFYLDNILAKWKKLCLEKKLNSNMNIISCPHKISVWSFKLEASCFLVLKPEEEQQDIKGSVDSLVRV